MALIKTVETPYGVNANYWNIGVFIYNKRDKICQVVLDGYIDKEARNSGKIKIYCCELTLPYIEAESLSLSKVYDLVKLNGDWIDAENDTP